MTGGCPTNPKPRQCRGEDGPFERFFGGRATLFKTCSVYDMILAVDMNERCCISYMITQSASIEL